MKMQIEFEIAKESLNDLLKLKEPYKKLIATPPVQKYTVKGTRIYKANDKKVCGHCIAGNTYRTFARIDSKKNGASEIVEDVLVPVSKKLVKDLEKINTREELNTLSNRLRKQIYEALSEAIKSEKIKSYNVCRKLVDLYISHFVILSADVSPALRKKILPLLFVPLDSQIMGELFKYFGDSDVLKLSMKFPNTEASYQNLQALISGLCNGAKLPAPIAFDLLWNKRYSLSGEDFFQVSKNAAKTSGKI